MITELLDWFGYISSIIVILGAVWWAILWLRGIIPLSIRAGRIRQNKVAIFANPASYSELKDSMDGTKLFGKNSFKDVSTVNNIDVSDGHNIFVVNWADWANDIDAVLAKKKADTGIIVYAPHPIRIADNDMSKLQTKNFVTVTNFRGRLITDLLAMAIAIRYAKK
jgi:hypothetical protein